MKQVRPAYSLPHPNNSHGNGTGTLYAAEYTESDLNGSKKFMKLYVQDHNMDIVEMKSGDNIDVDLLTKDFIQIRENFLAVETNPVILFMVRKSTTGAIDYNPETISRLFTKLRSEIELGNVKPSIKNASTSNSISTLYDIGHEDIVFGSVDAYTDIDSSDIVMSLKDILTDLSLRFMKGSGVVMDEITSIKHRIFKEFTSSIMDVASLNLKFDTTIMESAETIMKASDMQTLSVDAQKILFSEPLVEYKILDFVNGSSNTMSMITFTDLENSTYRYKNPIVDVSIFRFKTNAQNWETYYDKATFRIDKTLQIKTNIYAPTSTYHIPETGPIEVINGFKYLIVTSWKMRPTATFRAMGLTAARYLGFNRVVEECATNDILWGTVDDHNTRYTFTMTNPDASGQYMLNIVDVSSNTVVNSFRSRLTEPTITEKIFKFEYEGRIGYFAMAKTKNKNGPQPKVNDTYISPTIGGGIFYIQDRP